jgi:predicted CopG family antitoxin
MSKTITVSDEAYRRIKAQKMSADESFSDVILAMFPDPKLTPAKLAAQLKSAAKARREKLPR